MLRKLLFFMVILVGVAGCASKPVIVDNTPLNATAVIEQHVVSNGIKGFLPFETTELHFVRANMRRDESNFKGTGIFTGFLIGTRSGTEIARIDRKLKWSLNAEKAEYTECPLQGCPKPSRQVPARQDHSVERPPQAKHEAACTMHIAHSSFAVNATGQKKSINGFDTEQYQAAWVVVLRDNSERNTTSTLNMDIWTTTMTNAMRDALAVDASYAREFNGAVVDTAKPKIIPADAARMITAYLANSLKPGDVKSFLDAGRQLEKIKGYPISTNLAWNMAGNACAPKERKEVKEKSSPSPANAGDLVSGIASIFAKKKTEDTMQQAASEPILSFTFEVKQLNLEPVHDSVFTVPSGYHLVSQP